MPPQLDCESPNPLGLIVEDHCWHLVLCDGLERIADHLPYAVDHQLASLVSEALKTAIHQHNLLEDEGLFPLMLPRVDKGSKLLETIAQLSREHEMDGEHALEIAHELDQFYLRNSVGNPEMLGYMLRGFFQSMRRHISWENQTILPLAAELLTSADLAALSAWHSTHPEQLRCRRLLKQVGQHLGHASCPDHLIDMEFLHLSKNSAPGG